jgi:GNAT superfamily N-acetyltransferase
MSHTKNQNIKFHKTFQQTSDLIHSCEKISSTCNEFDGLQNPFFVDDAYEDYSDFPWLYYASIHSHMVGFLSIYKIDSYNMEICGFVLPQYRRNKIATSLFSKMVTDFESKYFQLSMDLNNDFGKAFVSQMGFGYCSTECSMKLDKNDFSPFNNTLELIPEKQQQQILIHGRFNDVEVGRAIISVFHSTACIHDVEIFEEYRRNGYGYKLIATLLNHIFEKYDSTFLHVTKENIPAYNLYRKIGFQVVRELEYYDL